MKTMFAQMMAILLLTAIAKNTCYSQIIDLEESVACVVSDVSGKVTYKEKGSDTVKPVTAGVVIPENAFVTVPDNASFTLANANRSLTITKKGTYQMTALTKDVQEKGTESMFAKMAFAAKGYARDTTSVKKGWGDKDSLLFEMPLKGKLPLQSVTFRWTALKDNPSFKLVIFQNSLETPVLSVYTSANSFSFDPAQLAIKTGQTCFAQVFLANDSKTASKVLSITFVPQKEVEMVIASLMNEQEYIKSDAAKKLLLEAVELDSKNYKSSAALRYQRAMKLDTNNVLAAQMYAAFLDSAD